MIVTVTGLKGGVGKTTSAIHLAAYLSNSAPTVLCDMDDGRSSLLWHSLSKGSLPFDVVPPARLAKVAGDYTHLVMDTDAQPRREFIKELTDSCDFVVLPTEADILSLHRIQEIVEHLVALKFDRYRVLITKVPPNQSEGKEAMEYLDRIGIPYFKKMIRRIAAFPRAAARGVTVDRVRSMSTAALGWNDYEEVGNEIEEILGVNEEETSPKKAKR